MTVARPAEALLLESANDAAGDARRGHRRLASRRSCAQMNERARRARPDRHAATRTRSGSTTRQLLDARATSPTLAARPAAQPRFARDRRHAAGARCESGIHPRVVENRNVLIGRYPFVDGVKTGHTTQAGYVLVGAAARATAAQVISVVLGEPSEAARDADTLTLLRWGLGRFHRVPVLDRRRPLATRRTSSTATSRPRSCPPQAARVTLRDGRARARAGCDAPDELDGPARRRARGWARSPCCRRPAGAAACRWSRPRTCPERGRCGCSSRSLRRPLDPAHRSSAILLAPCSLCAAGRGCGCRLVKR